MENRILEKPLTDYIREKHTTAECTSYIDGFEKAVELLQPITWVKFDFLDLTTRPPQPDKYLICRKDGKIHWETWNGNGWAYNHNEIRYWAKIVKPLEFQS